MYWKRSPYESRVATPSVKMIKNQRIYDVSFKLKRKIPMAVIYQLTKRIGT